RHVGPLALDDALAEALAARDAEVGDADLAGGGEEEIARADVGVDDGAARADVGELEAAGGGLHDVGRHAEREAVRAARLDELAQAGAVDELHHEEDVVALAREIEDAHDVAVLHADEE